MNGRSLAIETVSRATSASRNAPPAPRRDNAVDRLDAKPGHAQQHLARGAVDVDRESCRET